MILHNNNLIMELIIKINHIWIFYIRKTHIYPNINNIKKYIMKYNKIMIKLVLKFLINC